MLAAYLYGPGDIRLMETAIPEMCSEYSALGINLDGGFAEYVKIPEEAVRQGNMIELDVNVTYDEAALNEPLSCVYNGFLKCGIKPGDNVLIIGTGPIGIMHAKLAKMAGAADGTKTALFTTNGAKAAEAFEASKLINPSKGVVQQDPDDIYGSVLRTILEVVRKSGVRPQEIAAVFWY